MKKLPLLLAAITALMMAFALTACSSPSPSDVVDKTLTAIKANDSKSLAQYYKGDNLNLGAFNFNSISDAESSSSNQSTGTDSSSDASKSSESTSADASTDAKELTEDEQKILTQLTDKILDYDYEIGEETINGDTATVKVNFTSYDLKTPVGEALASYLEDAFGAAMVEAFGGAKMDQDKLLAGFYEDLADGLEKQTEKNTTAEATFNLSKVDGQWVVDQVNDDVLDAMTGGLYKSLNDFSEGLESSESK